MSDKTPHIERRTFRTTDPRGAELKAGDVVKMDGASGFELARLRRVETIKAKSGPTLRLFHFTTPQRYRGRLYSWRIEYGNTDSKRKFTPKEFSWIPAKTKAEADAAFDRQEKAFLAFHDRIRTGRKSSSSEDDVDGAQLQFLGRLYPATLRAMKAMEEAPNDAERERLHRLVAAEYKAEVFARTGDLLDGPADDYTRRRIFAAMRRKPKRFDAVGFELALNWLRRGYRDMTPSELACAVEKVTGKRLLPGTIKRRRERLGLTTSRTPGLPAL